MALRTMIHRHGPSNGARALSQETGFPLLRINNSRYQYREGDTVINWGSSRFEPTTDPSAYVNHPTAVRNSRRKTRQYGILSSAGINTCEWTPDRALALRWLAEGIRVLHRTLERGSQGRGITAYSTSGTEYTAPAEDLGTGGFYVKLFGDVRTNEEYRIHVMDDKVIDRQMKRRRSRENGYEGRIDPYVRSSGNGWVFCRDGLGSTAELDREAIKAVEALGLDFGAVDCARSSDGRTCIYEVNTAPGLEGTTLDRYSRGFEERVARYRAARSTACL